MQYYQKRDFGALISDTLTFFKQNGKNYFKNYLLINGILLILLVVIFILGFRELFSQLLGSNLDGEIFYFESYFQENQGVLIFTFVLIFILFMAISVVAYSYPVLYMKRVSETGNRNITSDEIIRDIRSNFGRLIGLFLGLLFIVTPLAMVVLGISYALMLVLIGFFLMLLLMPAMMNVVNFLLYDYFHSGKGFFQALHYAVKAQFSYPDGYHKTPFWKYWGSSVVVYLIIQTITSILSMIPMVILIAMMYTTDTMIAEGRNPFQGTAGILFFGIYGVSILVSFLLMNVMMVNAGLMYYDSRTDLHRRTDLTEIDTIGHHEA
ncbi:DUF4013 domain-containing protein [Chryseobacterium sp. MFBS3-17]|uniref:DUF4013 domain-containing protein n=1 Tax=Chryseobacterium sp. MFBS3-17 TaxID=2886689 RepID=UPI001D0DC162|nr:DUF4013 domain-containing protein [Chryseobacterium sp. MFBS3-17]MCC2589537.1 DUF4013 domain-containing protein [Chryseobacterium sp. MFBS3-17]